WQIPATYGYKQLPQAGAARKKSGHQASKWEIRKRMVVNLTVPSPQALLTAPWANVRCRGSPMTPTVRLPTLDFRGAGPSPTRSRRIVLAWSRSIQTLGTGHEGVVLGRGSKYDARRTKPFVLACMVKAERLRIASVR